MLCAQGLQRCIARPHYQRWRSRREPGTHASIGTEAPRATEAEREKLPTSGTPGELERMVPSICHAAETLLGSKAAPSAACGIRRSGSRTTPCRQCVWSVRGDNDPDQAEIRTPGAAPGALDIIAGQ